MIRAIYWDFGGVLVDVDMSRAQQAWEGYFDVPWRDFERGFFGSGLKEAFDGGDVTLSDVVDGLRSSVEPRLTTEKFEEIWSRVVPARTEMVALAHDLSEHVWTGVISNTDPVHAEAIRRQIGDLGRHWVLSYDVRSLKPKPLIFERAIEISPASAGETFFVDDLEENVEAARRIGIVGHTFVSMQGLVGELERLGIM